QSTRTHEGQNEPDGCSQLPKRNAPDHAHILRMSDQNITPRPIETATTRSHGFDHARVEASIAVLPMDCQAPTLETVSVTACGGAETTAVPVPVAAEAMAAFV